MTSAGDRASEILLQGILDRAFPAATAEVGRADGPLWRRAFGSLSYEPGSPEATPDTVFDLASLTKVIATTTLVMRAVDDGVLSLDERVSSRFPEWRGADRQQVTVRDVLTHASGLPAYLPFFRDHTGRVEFEPAICHTPLEYTPRSQSVYSDLGFMLLGFLLEDLRRSPSLGGGRLDPSASLASQFRRVASFITMDPLAFNPPRQWRLRTAPTEREPWRGRLLTGEVHDENAWALGGAAGHAGLFGTAAAVGAFAQSALRTIAGEHVLSPASDVPRVHPARQYSRQLQGARLGHDAAHIVMRHADVCNRDRPHGLYRYVAVARLGARSLRGTADQPRASVTREHSHPGDPACISRCRHRGIRREPARAVLKDCPRGEGWFALAPLQRKVAVTLTTVMPSPLGPIA